MNWLDIVILLPLAGGLVSGYKNGLIGEVASLAGLILGIWGAIKFSGWTAGLIEQLHWETPYIHVIAFIITFLVIVILMQVLSRLISKLMEAMLLGWVNRLAGIVVGLLKALLFTGVLLFVINYLDDRRTLLPDEVKTNSKLYEPVSQLVPTLLPFLPLDRILGRPEADSSGQTY